MAARSDRAPVRIGPAGELDLSTAPQLRREWDLTLIPGPAAVQRVFELTGTAERLPFVPAPARGPVPRSDPRCRGRWR